MSFIEAALAYSESLAEKGASTVFSDLRAQGKVSLQAHAWPSKKTEAWRYTNLQKLAKSQVFSSAKPAAGENDACEVEQLKDVLSQSGVASLHTALGANTLVFVDGNYSEALSDISDEAGLTVQRFSQVDEVLAAKLARKLGSVADKEKHLFVAANQSHLQDGVYLHVQADRKIHTPVVLIHLNTEKNEHANARLFVDLERSAELKVLEYFFSDVSTSAPKAESAQSFTNACSEFELAENAKLDYFRINREHENTHHMGGIHAKLDKHSRLNSFHIAFGTVLTRLDIGVKCEGEGSHAELNGVYLPRKQQHVDFHVNMEHCVPHTSSNEVFRGIVGDSARAVFNGRIHILPQAQKTDARLSNKNLLTSAKAEVDTKPELEIYANDVQCAHGATVAQLNNESLHYFRTRGVSEEEARVMLSFGFINELIEKIPEAAVSDHLRPLLALLFARSEALTQHLL